jgi:hypothetical protein
MFLSHLYGGIDEPEMKIICKVADNTDPLRGIFAFKSDPF